MTVRTAVYELCRFLKKYRGSSFYTAHSWRTTCVSRQSDTNFSKSKRAKTLNFFAPSKIKVGFIVMQKNSLNLFFLLIFMLYLIIKCYFLPLFCWAFKTVFFSVNSVPIKYLESYIFFTHLCILCNKMPQRRDSAGAVCNSSMAIFWLLMYLILFFGGRVGFFIGQPYICKALQ